MNLLEINDAFAPYYEGRKPFTAGEGEAKAPKGGEAIEAASAKRPGKGRSHAVKVPRSVHLRPMRAHFGKR